MLKTVLEIEGYTEMPSIKIKLTSMISKATRPNISVIFFKTDA
jgi:hypothetical protein